VVFILCIVFINIIFCKRFFALTIHNSYLFFFVSEVIEKVNFNLKACKKLHNTRKMLLPFSFSVSFFFFLNYFNSVRYWQFRANFQCLDISETTRLLLKDIVFNFYLSLPTTYKNKNFAIFQISVGTLL
jgi:hypothetical protein